MRGSCTALRTCALLRPPRCRAAPMASAAAEPPAGASSAAVTRSLAPRSTRDDGFRVVAESVAYKRYLTVFDRTVEFPAPADAAPGAARARFAYDVVGHPRAQCHFVAVLPFHSGPEAAVTLVREFAQGPNALVWSLPAGGVDPARHASLEDTAAAELSEECHMLPGTLVRLTPDTHPGFLETKWCCNRYTPYLCIDPVPDPAPGARDAEESAMTIHRVPLSRLEELLYGDDVLPPTVITVQLALRELRKRGLLPQS